MIQQPATHSILRTKLFTPAPQPPLVMRPNLLERLNSSLAGRMTLITAPAGFGKTTLVSQWIDKAAKNGRYWGWLSLDEADNDPGRFWLYAWHACELGGEAVGDRVGWLNAVAAAKRPFSLVLDDFHLLTNEALLEQISHAVDQAPPNLHLVLTSRSRPTGLPLARWTIRRWLVEINARQLRFDRPETAAFLQQSAALTLEEAELDQLMDETRGWVAALQMIVIGLREGRALPDVLSRLAGQRTMLFEYLTEELLTSLPDDVRIFLQETAVLERFCASLCEAITSRTDADHLLARLAQSHLFIVPLDDERVWFRYHHLFAEALRTHPDTAQTPVAERHLRAATWLADHNLIEEAIPHALAAEAWEVVLRLLKPGANMLGFKQLREWMSQIPRSVLLSNLKLCVEYADALLFTGRFAECETWLTVLEDVLADAAPSAINANILCNRATIAQWRGDLDQTLKYLKIAKPLLKETDPSYAGVYINLGRVAAYRNELTSSEAAFNDAYRFSEAIENDWYGMLVSRCQIGRLHLAQGNWATAARIYTEEQRLHQRPIAAWAWIGAGWLKGLRGEVATGSAELTEALTQMRSLGNRFGEVYGCLLLALLQDRLDGQDKRPFSLVDRAEQICTIFEARILQRDVRLVRAWLWLRRGMVNEGVGWWHGVLKRPFSLTTDLTSYWGETANSVAARWAMQAEEVGMAKTLLDRFAANIGAYQPRELRLWLLRAQLFAQQGDKGQTESSLMAALAQSESPYALAAWLWEGEPLYQLLQETAVPLSLANLKNRLLRRLAETPQRQTKLRVVPTAIGEKTAVALTLREVEVLRLIADGLSNKQAGEQLTISRATIKRHLSNIYDKLNVRNRAEAIAAAHEMGIF